MGSREATNPKVLNLVVKLGLTFLTSGRSKVVTKYLYFNLNFYLLLLRQSLTMYPWLAQIKFAVYNLSKTQLSEQMKIDLFPEPNQYLSV